MDAGNPNPGIYLSLQWIQTMGFSIQSLPTGLRLVRDAYRIAVRPLGHTLAFSVMADRTGVLIPTSDPPAGSQHTTVMICPDSSHNFTTGAMRVFARRGPPGRRGDNPVQRAHPDLPPRDGEAAPRATRPSYPASPRRP